MRQAAIASTLATASNRDFLRTMSRQQSVHPQTRRRPICYTPNLHKPEILRRRKIRSKPTRKRLQARQLSACRGLKAAKGQPLPTLEELQHVAESQRIAKAIAVHLKDPSIGVQSLASLSVAQMGAFAEEEDDLHTALMNYTKREATFARARLATATARLEGLKA
jgi:hypothetical protein